MDKKSVVAPSPSSSSANRSGNAKSNAGRSTQAPILTLPDEVLQHIVSSLSYATHTLLCAVSNTVLHSGLCEKKDIADKKLEEKFWREKIVKELSSRPELLMSYLIEARAKANGKSVEEVKWDPPSYREVYYAHKQGIRAFATKLNSCSFFGQRIPITEYFIKNYPHFYPDSGIENNEFLVAFPTSSSIENLISTNSVYFKQYPKHAEHLRNRFLESTQIVELTTASENSDHKRGAKF